MVAIAKQSAELFHWTVTMIVGFIIIIAPIINFNRNRFALMYSEITKECYFSHMHTRNVYELSRWCILQIYLPSKMSHRRQSNRTVAICLLSPNKFLPFIFPQHTFFSDLKWRDRECTPLCGKNIDNHWHLPYILLYGEHWVECSHDIYQNKNYFFVHTMHGVWYMDAESSSCSSDAVVLQTTRNRGFFFVSFYLFNFLFWHSILWT